MEHKQSKYAWAALVGGVAAYDILCSPGETLSEGMDRMLESKGKYIALGSVAITAAHLINILPPALDPLHQLTALKSLRKDR